MHFGIGYRRTISLIVAAIMAADAGCSMAPNSRVSHYGNTRLSGELREGRATYSLARVSFGRAGATPEVLIEAKDGEPIALSEFADVGILKRLGPPRTERELYDPAGRRVTEWGFGEGLWVVVADGKVMEVRLGADPKGNSRAIWDMNRRNRYLFPLDEDDVRMLLGKPDRVVDSTAL